MPRRRTYDYNRFSGGSGAAGLNQAIQNLGKALQERREAPQREEDRQFLMRERAFKTASDMLALGMDKNQIVRELGKVGFAFPEREITDRTLAFEPVPGEDPEAQAFIPRVERTRRETDLSGLESPREKSTREAQELDTRTAAGERRRFELGQEGKIADEQREAARGPRNLEEQTFAILSKIKAGEPLSDLDTRFLVAVKQLRSGDPTEKQKFEDQITRDLSLYGEAGLDMHQRDYYLSNMLRRDRPAQQRQEGRDQERLDLAKQSLVIQQQSREDTREDRTGAREAMARDRAFTNLDTRLHRITEKFERRRRLVLPGRNEQQDLDKIDRAEAFERAQEVGRTKKLHPKYAADIEGQYGVDVGPGVGRGPGRGPLGPGGRPPLTDLFGPPSWPPGGQPR